MYHPTDRIAHTTAFATPVVEHWLERVEYKVTTITVGVNYREQKKEVNVLFNDALNTFYLRLYGVRHMVKGHSAGEETRCGHHIGYTFCD